MITGGPGTGKTSCIEALKARGYTCFDEVSRAVILKAREQGIEQLFLTEPLRFSEMLLEGRKAQHNEALEHSGSLLFLDRGLPDVLAYMDYKAEAYPDSFTEACIAHPYTQVFVLAPWEAIYQSDNERYETFEQAEAIHQHLLDAYTRFGYQLHDVPFGSVEARIDFILNAIH